MTPPRWGRPFAASSTGVEFHARVSWNASRVKLSSSMPAPNRRNTQYSGQLRTCQRAKCPRGKSFFPAPAARENACPPGQVTNYIGRPSACKPSKPGKSKPRSLAARFAPILLRRRRKSLRDRDILAKNDTPADAVLAALESAVSSASRAPRQAERRP